MEKEPFLLGGYLQWRDTFSREGNIGSPEEKIEASSEPPGEGNLPALLSPHFLRRGEPFQDTGWIESVPFVQALHLLP